VTRPVVADTGPLIALATVDRLALLHRRYEAVVIPPAVHAELAVDSDRPGARSLSEDLSAAWLTVRPAPDPALVAELARLLDPGEAEAIALAEREPARFLLVDDARARRAARRRGIAVVGVAGVLLAATSKGAIPTVRPAIERLADAGYRLSDALVAEVLVRAGE